MNEDFAALSSQVADMQNMLGTFHNELMNHQHNGTAYSNTNDGDLFHTTYTQNISPTSGAASFNPASSSVFTLTPTGSSQLSLTDIPNGYIFCIVIKTSGTTSYTIDFQTGFTTTATLSTGTATGRYFTITFACDGVGAREIARTVAMLPY